jgi:hypothetical protein
LDHELKRLKPLIFKETEISGWPSIGADKEPSLEADFQDISTVYV